jgi:hypothetical protein
MLSALVSHPDGIGQHLEWECKGEIFRGVEAPPLHKRGNHAVCLLHEILMQERHDGASDEVGFHAVENPVTIHDFHATILHLLGIDHTRLTVRHNGIDRRLTDVHGHVIEGILA